ncbi:MAG: SGNH/GDSL hydrolase family protein [Lentisphaerae bacterium]|jgi:hypothetical protein|nr:SGNH/GDSL hydrolase family protein [Lentisphaerota bacterium]MBT4817386.1 SGNH/GDSL hydrolase family protein [Lentisphaerota bacterium]MBT5606156.1 SGNH/GDSL hydrolase family protein [Lentisphaerota bacterium]MBT7056375.1 SGNH/GDSL hydrolase family protein [Lentisphaerota bacterium]MBT7842949.1 SGNH/GDSL hydrolase family protein [Lentisphaerota bacterium]
MARTFRVTLVAAVLTIGAWAAPKAPYPLRDTAEFTVRGGCPTFFKKLDDGRAVKIGYLGGSITAQNGWRPKTLAWFREQYPAATVDQIHAAIGGTGSGLGVFRLQNDVLRHNPDLLFVEFAVNDGGAAPASITRSMEGIVRQAWAANPDLDICFVYTATVGMLKDLQAGKFPRAASVMETIADHYAIPSIHMCLKAARMEKEGSVIFKEAKSKKERLAAMAKGTYYFSKDGVHPYDDTGHVLYLEAVARGMQEIRKVGQPASHTLGAPLDPNNLEKAQMVPFGEGQLSPEWKLLDPKTDSMAKRFRSRFPRMWMANTPGATVSFKIKGSVVNIFDLLGSRCGVVKMTVDGKVVGERARFDPYCTYYRLSQLGVKSGLDPEAVHTVTLELTDKQPDRRKILTRRAGPNKKVLDLDDAAFAKRFDGTEWYAGHIMFVGEFVK